MAVHEPNPTEKIKVKRISVEFLRKMYPIDQAEKVRIEKMIYRMLKRKKVNTENIRIDFKYYH